MKNRILILGLLLLSFFATSQTVTTSGNAIRKEINTKFVNGLVKQYNISKLRQLKPTITDSSTVYCNTENYELYAIDDSDTTTPDDSENTIVTANGKRLKKAVTNNELPSLKAKLQAVVNNSTTDKVFWTAFGDSMAGSKTQFIFPHLSQMIGQAGAVGSGNYNGVTFSGGTVGTEQNYNVYPFTYTAISQGSYAQYGLNGVNATANTWKIYYVNNGAKINVKIDDIDVVGYSAFQTSNDNTVGVINVTTTLASHKFQIFANTGTVKIASIGIWDSTRSGLIPVYLNEGGNDMNNWINSPSDLAINNLFAILTDINPDVFSFEMKEDVNNLQSRVSKLFSKIKQSTPNAEIVTFLTTPVVSDETAQTQKKANNIYKIEAKSKGFSFFDCFQKVKSYENMVRLNWQGDGIHPDVKCQKYLVDEFLKDFNLYDLFGSTGKKSYAEQANVIGVNFNNEQGKIEADTQFGYDIKIRSKRWVQFTDLAGTEKMRFDLGGNFSDGSQSLLPYVVQIGANNARLRGDGANLLKIVSATNASQLANLQLLDIYPVSIKSVGNNIPILNGSGGEIIKFFNDNTVGMADGSVNTSTPSSILTLTSTTKGFLLPRMTTAQVNAISSPNVGLMVYNTDLACTCFFDGFVWKKISHSNM